MATVGVHLGGLARKLVIDGVIEEEVAVQAFEEALSEKVPFVSHIVAKGLADPTKIAHVAADEFSAVLMDISSMELERDVHPISRRKVNPKTSRLTDLQAGKSVVHGGLGSNKSASLGRD